jgi:hypothetical protein
MEVSLQLILELGSSHNIVVGICVMMRQNEKLRQDTTRYDKFAYYTHDTKKPTERGRAIYGTVRCRSSSTFGAGELYCI